MAQCTKFGLRHVEPAGQIKGVRPLMPFWCFVRSLIRGETYIAQLAPAAPTRSVEDEPIGRATFETLGWAPCLNSLSHSLTRPAAVASTERSSVGMKLASVSSESGHRRAETPLTEETTPVSSIRRRMPAYATSSGSENRLHRGFLRAWKQVAVAAAHLVGRGSDPGVDDSLVDSFGRTVAAKKMA